MEYQRLPISVGVFRGRVCAITLYNSFYMNELQSFLVLMKKETGKQSHENL
jgi:hypothetical protein